VGARTRGSRLERSRPVRSRRNTQEAGAKLSAAQSVRPDRVDLAAAGSARRSAHRRDRDNREPDWRHHHLPQVQQVSDWSYAPWGNCREHVKRECGEYIGGRYVIFGNGEGEQNEEIESDIGNGTERAKPKTSS
jgi:hypothetical protein